MTWQKIKRHVSHSRIVVESKSGNTYPVETERDRLGKSLYSLLMNEANDHRTYWAWVDFDEDDPILRDYSTGAPDGGPPENLPWEHP